MPSLRPWWPLNDKSSERLNRNTEQETFGFI